MIWLLNGWGRLVAAGVVLRGDQYEARTLGSRLSLRRLAKSLQNSDDGSISGTDAEAHGRNHGNAENEKHEERIHGQPPLSKCRIRCHGHCFRIPQLFPDFRPASSI